MHVRYMSMTLGTEIETVRQSSSGNEYSDGIPPKSLTSSGSGVATPALALEECARACAEPVTKVSSNMRVKTSRQARTAVTATMIHIM